MSCTDKLQMMTRILRRALGLVFLGSTTTLNVGHAQLGIESIFKDITDVSFYAGCWDTNSDILRSEGDCPFGNRDYGVEVSFRVAEFPFRRTSEVVQLVPKEVVSGPRGQDTTYEVRKAPKINGAYVLLELGLGYSQFTGFGSSDPKLDLRGAVRELPSVSLYVSLRHTKLPLASVYGGIRSGIIQTRDLQVFSTPVSSPDSAVVFGGDAQAFQAGGVGGVMAEYRRFAVFAEAALINREFSSIRWTSPGTNKVPPSIPRRLDFSGESISIGVQIKIR